MEAHMKLHAFTASACERNISCPGNLHMPWAEDKPSAAAKRGTVAHEWIEYQLHLPWIDKREEKWPQCVDVASIRSYIGDTVFHTEQMMGYNVLEQRTVVYSDLAERKYPERQAGDVFGTADLIIETYPIQVIDHKSGRDIGPPHESWQMRMLSLMVARFYGVDEVQPGIMYIGKDGGVELDKGELLTCMDLDATEAAIRKALESSERRGGNHCKYCRAISCEERRL